MTSRAVFIGSEIYRRSTYGGQHPLAIPRVSTVIDLCRALDWFGAGEYRASPRAKPGALAAFHTPDYIAALQRAEKRQTVTDVDRSRHGLGTLSNPVFPEMFRRPATAAGGSLLGAELALGGLSVFNPGGGTHHGFADRAGGFCYLNDPVLAILAMLRAGLDRVAYVDIDAHHCDGVASAFHGSQQVRMISLHEDRRWPFTGGVSDTAGGAAYNIPVPRGFNDSEFELILDEVILPAVAGFRPQAIVLQCGADAVTEDPLSRLCLSNRCHWKTVGALQQLSSCLLVLGGGGYNPWSVARLWTGVWAILSGRAIPDHLPEQAQNILRALDWQRQRGQDRPQAWFTTLRDAPRTGPIRSEVRQTAGLVSARLSTWA
ncbi:acetoin utilization protein AcuC [Ruegeria aquimaris]|uniref:Acetoin utilization protein AcuC n=1 Tax=Ruegeria aquimaris TaxID=2984333 RepID=A0ABT3ARE3_9RHOB|nr:acetoin utilization protein AcuC [Ruegeria sp. XHP0148]MCV2891253.1 acetoin utilization protein AcuC [Ruegeria sp. XHP0148]